MIHKPSQTFRKLTGSFHGICDTTKCILLPWHPTDTRLTGWHSSICLPGLLKIRFTGYKSYPPPKNVPQPTLFPMGGGGEKRSIISITSPVKIPEKLCWRIWRFLFCQPSRTSAVCSTEPVPLWLCKPNKTKVKSEILYSRNWKWGVVKSHRIHQNSVLLWQGQFPRIDVKHRIIF